MPPRSWEGVYDARRLSPACIQYDSMNYITEHYPGFNKSSEDCLYLNVYVPEVTMRERKREREGTSQSYAGFTQTNFNLLEFVWMVKKNV